MLLLMWMNRLTSNHRINKKTHYHQIETLYQIDDVDSITISHRKIREGIQKRQLNTYKLKYDETLA